MATPSRSTNPARELGTVDGLVQLSFVVHGALERRASEEGLSIVQMRLLGVLRDRTPTMKDLARALGLDKSSVTGLVDRAERRGLIERVQSTADGRAVHVRPTRTGRAVTARVAKHFAADVAALLDALPAADRKALSSSVSRVLVADATARGIDLFATSAQGAAPAPTR